MPTVIPIRPAALSNNEPRIAVFIPNQEEWIALIEKVPQRCWSPTHACWHFPKTLAHWTTFQTHFIDVDLNIQKEAAPLSIPMWETQIAPQLEIKAGYVPPIVVAAKPDVSGAIEMSSASLTSDVFSKPTAKTPFKVEKVFLGEQYFIAVPIDFNDKESQIQIKTIDGFAWHPQEKMWLLPYNVASLKNLQKMFGDKLQLPKVRDARLIKPPMDMPKLALKSDYQNKQNNPLWNELKSKQQSIADEKIANQPINLQRTNPQEVARQDFESTNLETLLAAHNQQQPVTQIPVQVTDKIIVRLAQFWEGYLRLDFYYRKDWIGKLKQINGSRWHKEHNCWTLPHSPLVIDILNKMFGDALQYNLTPLTDIQQQDAKIQTLKFETLPPQYKDEISRLEAQMILKRMAQTTIKTYKNSFSQFLHYYNDIHPKDITKEQIISYMLHRIRVDKISVSIQNNFINAIKCYYEFVLGRDRTYYDLQRPKKPFQLPNVLSQEEVVKLLQAVNNIKHKCILLAIYSGGLRLSEVINLRIADLHKDNKSVFVKAGKGKKDRYTLLSDILLKELDIYYQCYQPKYWVFEGQTGGQYTARSVQMILRDAVIKSGINPFATVHTLRHSFATHLVLAGHDILSVQKLMGHESPETTQIYVHLTGEQIRRIQSPLDKLKF